MIEGVPFQGKLKITFFWMIQPFLFLMGQQVNVTQDFDVQA